LATPNVYELQIGTYNCFWTFNDQYPVAIILWLQALQV